MESCSTQAARILIVDDEPSIVRLLQAYLQREGFEVATAADGRAALQIARSLKPQLVVLDLLLPEVDGLEVCRLLRQESDVYIIMLTARSEETDKIVGLTVGADDYVTKPFSPREMVARIKAVLRRTRRLSLTTAPQTLRFPDLTIDTGRHTVTVRGQDVELTALDFEILRTLAAQPGMVFSRSQLLERVWGYDHLGDERVVDVHIGLLRKKIEQDVQEPQFVKTVRGVGYKFDDPGGDW
ncbi:MAG: two component transcriptional regulator, winged helix family [Chloroflexi bacterium]|nr:two component transcriptional regulator, winged helix family [Chloroflexota bacterium]MDB5077138.1 two component transcriptional regulator, winged helix family [Chloroflexota bacterium]